MNKKLKESCLREGHTVLPVENSVHGPLEFPPSTVEPTKTSFFLQMTTEVLFNCT